jgi:hypothetical protein
MWKHIVAVTMLLATGMAAGKDRPLTEQDLERIAQKLSTSLVQVEIQLQMDNGEAPREVCPNCGRVHNQSEHLEQERPMVRAGYLLSDHRVLLRDPSIHPRFIKSWAVRFGEQTAGAKPVALARQQPAMLLELEGPLAGAVPLAFQANGKVELGIQYVLRDGRWYVSATAVSLAPTVFVRTDQKHLSLGSVPPLLTDRKGVPVGICLIDHLRLGDSWKGSPLDWPMVSMAEIDRLNQMLGQRAARAAFCAQLNFRSPRGEGDSAFPFSRFMPSETGGGQASATEQTTLALLVGSDQVLVFAALDQGQTARLEKITLCPQEGEPIPASFVGSLKDFGCLVARPDQPREGAMELVPGTIHDYADQLLLTLRAEVWGKRQVVRFDHVFLSNLEVGWRNGVYPRFEGADRSVLVDLSGRVVAIPMPRRPAPRSERYSYHGDGESLSLPAQQCRELLADLACRYDSSNVPVTDKDEDRIGWMGVELQDVSSELAREKNVSYETRNGEVGGLVTFVYPDSPASQAGVKPGMVLLRLYPEGKPCPVDVKVEDERYSGMSEIWEHLDEIPEEYMDRAPSPWPSARSSLNAVLTKLGIGQRYTAEFCEDGKTFRRDFTVTASPPHYDSAPRVVSKDLGLTVRDLTFEVRRHLRRAPEEPGVVVSKVKPGSKAAVAGIKPFEVITHVNDGPVMNVAEFEKLTADQTTLNLSVKRMTRGRVLKIRMDRKAATTQSTTTQSAATAPAGPVASQPHNVETRP